MPTLAQACPGLPMVIDHLAKPPIASGDYDGWKADQGRVTMRGYFDIFPSDDRTDFFGTWGNYPYFGDGKVVVTSSDEGIFVLQSRAKSADKRYSRR